MFRPVTLLVPLALLAACGEKDGSIDSTPEVVITDEDGDGFDGVDHGGDDCDDANDAISPGAEEVCDGVDNNCDGITDDDAVDVATWHQDVDGDGYGAEAYTQAGCEAPTGYVADGTDCDDREAAAYPFADELCDGLDNDCDGEADELGAVDAPYWYPDNDGDGYGDPDYGYASCAAPGGVYIAQGDDCDDARGYVNPSAPEVCDEVDNNCDGDVDGADAEGAPTWYADADGDGFGDPNAADAGCEAPSGYIEDWSDCDDADGAINPDADEVCDGVDNDCDGTSDEADAVDASTWYADADADGYGDAGSSTDACDAPSGYVADWSDCDDGSSGTYPGAPEYCDRVDTDCDGTTDEPDALDASTWYADADSDGFGDAASTTPSCDRPSGYVSDASDCDDAAASDYPGADEICGDGADNDCDGTLDECAPLGTLSLSDAYASYYGEASDDGAGEAVAGGGDFDGDGYSDLLIGAPGESTGASNGGSVYVVYGPSSGGATSLADADLKLSLDVSTSAFGSSLTFVGDVNADGTDDFLVGGPTYDLPGQNYSNAGALYLVHGAISASQTVGVYVEDSSWHHIYGDGTSFMFGASVAALGDVEGDGYDDFIVGATGDPTGIATAGSAWLYYGPLTNTDPDFNDDQHHAYLYGETNGDEAGSAVAGGDDFNGDGVNDVLVGARYFGNDLGAAYLALGPVTGAYALSSADARWTGEGASDAAGSALAMGDLDGDGYSDAVVSAPTNGPGSVYVIYGATSATSANLGAADLILTGEASSDLAGVSVDVAGDVDGDGYLDFIAGADANDGAGTNAGAAYLWYGPTGNGAGDFADADAIFEGAAAQDRAGASVSGIGDHDGDGYDDLLIGARSEDSAATNAGAAYLWLGDVR